MGLFYFCVRFIKIILVDYFVDVDININKFEKVFMYFGVIKNIFFGFKLR